MANEYTQSRFHRTLLTSHAIQELVLVSIVGARSNNNRIRECGLDDFFSSSLGSIEP